MGDFFTDLSRDGARLVVRGADALNFLQNQLTCDVRTVGPARWTPGALCTVKGRVQSLFDVASVAGDAYALLVPADLAALTGEHFRRMLFRSKVTVEDASAALAALGVTGSHSEAILAETGLPVPAAPFEAATGRDVTVLRTPGKPRFVLLGPVDAIDAIRPHLGAAMPVGAIGAWRLAEIRAGVPRLAAATSEAFLPQFLDLDRRGGLSFTKGCYPGQEVVARTQHLGEVKRRLYAVKWDGDEHDASPGTPLRAIHDDGDRDGGTIVSAERADGSAIEALAVIPVAERTSGHPLRVGGPDGPRVEVSELP